MNLPLDIVRTTGRAAQPPPVSEVLRGLTQADIAALSSGEKGSRPPPLVRIRDRHHAVARLLAEGKKPGEVAVICGYDLSRISILQGDPAFKELVQFYAANVNAQYVDRHEQLAGLNTDAIMLLRERIEDDPDSFKNPFVLEVIKASADRTGLGPSSKSEVNVNVNLASRLEEARKRIANRTIDVTPNKDQSFGSNNPD